MPSGCLIKKEKKAKRKVQSHGSACELQAARLSLWLALSFVGESYFFSLVSNDYFFKVTCQVFIPLFSFGQRAEW